MTDIHAHFLPNVDDGASSFGEAVQMAHLAAADGITDVYCTPHLEPGPEVASLLLKYEAIRGELGRRLEEEKCGVRLHCGAEWLLSPELLDAVCEQGRLGGSSAFLFEVSGFMPLTAAEGLLGEAAERNFIPVLAHPERHPWLTDANVDSLGKLACGGCWFQLTAGSLTGQFGRGVRRCAEAVARRFPARIVLASDAHDTLCRRPQLSDGYNALENIFYGLKEHTIQNLSTLFSPVTGQDIRKYGTSCLNSTR